VQAVALGCRGVDNRELPVDGPFAVATCEISGQLVKLDLASRTVVGYLTLDPGGLDSTSMPQDIRSSPDGRVFYVADMKANGVFLIDPAAFRRIGFVATGKGTHGIYPSRDGRLMYITNRGWNTTAGGRHGPGANTGRDPGARRARSIARGAGVRPLQPRHDLRPVSRLLPVRERRLVVAHRDPRCLPELGQLQPAVRAQPRRSARTARGGGERQRGGTGE